MKGNVYVALFMFKELRVVLGRVFLIRSADVTTKDKDDDDDGSGGDDGEDDDEDDDDENEKVYSYNE